MTEELKPTNEEIAEYITDWINSLDGYGIVIVGDFEDYVLALGKSTNFDVLRQMFTPEMYSSIQEYADKTKGEE